MCERTPERTAVPRWAAMSAPRPADWLKRYGDLAVRHATDPDSLSHDELAELVRSELNAPAPEAVAAEAAAAMWDCLYRDEPARAPRMRLAAESARDLGAILGSAPTGTRLLADVVTLPAGAVVAPDAWLFKVEGDTVLVRAPGGVTVHLKLDGDEQILQPGQEERLALSVLDRKTIESHVDAAGRLQCVIR